MIKHSPQKVVLRVGFLSALRIGLATLFISCDFVNCSLPTLFSQWKPDRITFTVTAILRDTLRLALSVKRLMVCYISRSQRQPLHRNATLLDEVLCLSHHFLKKDLEQNPGRDILMVREHVIPYIPLRSETGSVSKVSFRPISRW